MKNKLLKTILIGLPFFSLMLSGCNLTPESGSSSSSSSPSTNTTRPTNTGSPSNPSTPSTAEKNITDITLNYSTDFFMQVGKSLAFGLSFTGGGDESQKGIAWHSSNESVVSISPRGDKSYQCTLNALKEGDAVITATSTYVSSITKSVTITVIDNSTFTYLYQKDKTGYSNNDQNQFNDEEVAKSSGTATLNGMDWDFTFETPSVKVTGGQALTFGTADAPFGNVSLSTTNTKKIRRISLYCSSAARSIDDGSQYGSSESVGSSKLTVKIGDTTYMNNVDTPKHQSSKSVAMVYGDDLGNNPLSGNISINFSPTYKKVDSNERGGSIYLKSIIIEYYRGPLTKIEVDGLYYQDEEGHDVRYEKTYQFYNQGYFSHEDLLVYATYSETNDKVDVTRHAFWGAENLDANGKFTAKGGDELAYARYSYSTAAGSSVTKTFEYPINVAGKLVSITNDGELLNKNYLEQDKIDYSGRKIHINTEDQNNFKEYDLGDYEKKEFLDIFDVTNLLKEATMSMNNGFSFKITHKPTKTEITINFNAGSVNVSQYVAKTYSRVKSIDDFASEGLYIITSIVPEDDKTMKVWNGALGTDTIMASGDVNNFEYSDANPIGDTLSIKLAKVEEAAFIIRKTSENKIQIILASTINDAKPKLLTANSNPNFKETTDQNAAAQLFEASFEDGNTVLANGDKQIVYNKYSTSKKFNVSTVSSNCVPVQVFKIN